MQVCRAAVFRLRDLDGSGLASIAIFAAGTSSESRIDCMLLALPSLPCLL